MTTPALASPPAPHPPQALLPHQQRARRRAFTATAEHVGEYTITHVPGSSGFGRWRIEHTGELGSKWQRDGLPTRQACVDAMLQHSESRRAARARKARPSVPVPGAFYAYEEARERRGEILSMCMRLWGCSPHEERSSRCRSHARAKAMCACALRVLAGLTLHEISDAMHGARSPGSARSSSFASAALARWEILRTDAATSALAEQMFNALLVELGIAPGPAPAGGAA